MKKSTRITLFKIQPMKHWLSRSFQIKVLQLLSVMAVVSSAAFAQGGCPTSKYPTLVSASSCTSKDLELLGAYLQGSDSCNPTEGPKKLYLIIKNKTGSTRTSFAVWGNLYKNGVLDTATFYACVGPVRPNSVDTILSCTELNYTSGTHFKIKNIFLAWTSASPNQTCQVLADNPNLIAPKCGTLDSLVIYTGVGASSSSVRASCPSNTGSITVTPSGGKAPPYEAALYSNGAYVDTASNITGSKTWLNQSAGTYTIKVYDSRGCGFEKTETILDPQQPAAPTVCKTEPTLCGSEFGTVKVTDSAAGYNYYAITNSGTIDNGTLATFTLPAGSTPRLYYTNGSAAACISDTASCPATACSAPPVAAEVASVAAKQTIQQQSQKGNLLGAGDLESAVTIKTIPNPFNNKVRFMINVAESGQGSLEIFNIQGQKIRTLYQGYVPAGTNFYDLTVPSVRRAELIYVFTKNGVKTSGKLVQIAKD